MSVFYDFKDIDKGKYGVIAADPPWQFRTFTGAGKTPTTKKFKGVAADHYPTMTFEEMAALDVKSLAADDCALLMWVVDSHLNEALDLAAEWGFKYKTRAYVWLKCRMIDGLQIDLFSGDFPPPSISMGYYTRKQLEDVFLFTKGKPKVHAHDVRQLIIEPRRQHSRKPDMFFPRTERLFGDVPRLELFSRQARDNWDTFGNQAETFQAALAAS